MARKTKAELVAEREAALAARLAEEQYTYPTRLLDSLELATKLGYELTVREGHYVVRKYGENAGVNLAPQWTKQSQDDLDSLYWDLDFEMEERRRAEERCRAKSAALAKLTPDERELLGL